ncbi:globin domain-containing protein [Arcobacter sp. YIC-464]|uniref:globin domain-containing protein n=1 Tax=Arcobacter sp. YIC-464 TaxID=3376631 RepID=UPI003C160E8E
MNDKTIKIIKTTAPIVRDKKDEITNTMYEILFSTYPETKVLFKDATDDQPKKLANAIYAYASNIDKLDNLTKGIETMVNAHVKTNIQAEHYPMVKDALLKAFQKVLGESCTLEIANAWAEAYDFLATVLIQKEKEAYSKIS